jgi:hypothetical protein
MFQLKIKSLLIFVVLKPAAICLMFLASTFFVVLLLFQRVQSQLLQATRPGTARETEMTVEQHVVPHESYVKCGSTSAGEN